MQKLTPHTVPATAGEWDTEVSVFAVHHVLPYAGGSCDQPIRFWDEVAARSEAMARIAEKQHDRSARSAKLDALLGD